MNRVFNILWALTIVAFLIFGYMSEDGLSPYSATILSVVLVLTVSNIIWPNWVYNVPDERVPLLVGGWSGIIAGFAAWTLLTPSLVLGVKVAGVAILFAVLAYLIVNSMRNRKEYDERKIVINVSR